MTTIFLCILTIYLGYSYRRIPKYLDLLMKFTYLDYQDGYPVNSNEDLTRAFAFMLRSVFS